MGAVERAVGLLLGEGFPPGVRFGAVGAGIDVELDAEGVAGSGFLALDLAAAYGFVMVLPLASSASSWSKIREVRLARAREGVLGLRATAALTCWSSLRASSASMFPGVSGSMATRSRSSSVP